FSKSCSQQGDSCNEFCVADIFEGRCLLYLLGHECCHDLHVAHGISFASVLDRLLAVLIEILGERLEETRLQRVASANRSAAWVARLARLEACLDGREISFTVNGIAHARNDAQSARLDNVANFRQAPSTAPLHAFVTR